MNAVSFFAGAGGLDTGIEQAGFDVKLTLEIDKICCDTLHLNRKHANIVQADIMDFNKEWLANIGVDLMFGGSPCQSFSTAGKRLAFSDPRGQAMLKFADLVNEIQPKCFLLENVRGLLSAALKHRPLEKRGVGSLLLEPDEAQGSALTFLLGRFRGYDTHVKLLNAADYGVPQARRRVFIVGTRNDLNISYNFPEPTHKGLQEGEKTWITVGEILKSLDEIEHNYTPYSKKRLEYMRMIPQNGGNWEDLPLDIAKEAMGGALQSSGGRTGYFRRIDVNKPSPTLLTSPTQKATNLGHPYKDRPLSIEEYLIIQGFPLNYRLAGTLQQQYKQIGNAVPIGLARAMGESIRECISGENRRKLDDK